MATFLAAYALVFLAELPDKTMYTVLLLATRFRAAPVLLGAWAAFLVHGAIAVLLGSVAGKLPEQWVRWAAAAVFLGFGLLLLLGKAEEPGAEEPEAGHGRAFLSTFGLVFLAEWGDATQLSATALVARTGERLPVFLGAVLALWTVAALGATAGRWLGPRLPRTLLRRSAGALFCVFGVLSLVWK